MEELRARSVTGDNLSEYRICDSSGATCEIPEPTWEIVAGERRFRAMTQVLDCEVIPCVVRELDDPSAARIMLAENAIRADLDPVEEGRAYVARLNNGCTIDELIAEGHKRTRIELLCDVVTLGPEALHMVARRQLAPTIARRMVGLDSNRQVLALRELAGSQLTSSQFAALCSRLLAEQEQEALFDPDDFLRAVEWAKSRPKLGKLGQARLMLKRCAVALEHTDPALAAEIRELLAEQSRS